MSATTMPAVVNYENVADAVELREIGVPDVPDDHVLLRTAAVSVCGSDLHQWTAEHSWPVNYPVVLGHEFAGVVAELGANVQGWREGDRGVSETAAVIDLDSPLTKQGLYNLDPTRKGFGYGVNGAMTRYVRVPARCLHHLPDTLPIEKAGLTEPCCVAYNAVAVNSNIKPGDRVVYGEQGFEGTVDSVSAQEFVVSVDVRLENANDPLQIIYTSGTTGDPKGVVFPNARFGAYAALGLIAGYQPGDRPYTGLSLTHGNAQAVTLGPALSLGLRAVFSRRFTKSKLWDVCRQYGCTAFSLLGGMATAIYSEPERPDDADNPVRRVTSAGMPVAIWEAFARRFDVEILEWYAAVEGGLAFNPVGVGPVGSFGKAPPTLEMKILDEHDRECPPGVRGEICSRPIDGSQVEVDYYGNPEASRAKTRGGWLRSGDVGHVDEQGWLYFDHRKGGGIRHNGDFIDPGFVEKAIAELPSVSDVFVYGIEAASGAPGEKDVVAAIVPTDAARFSAADVFAACRRSLESNFVPTYLQLVSEIPKTASEKPQERFLLAEFEKGAANVFEEVR